MKSISRPAVLAFFLLALPSAGAANADDAETFIQNREPKRSDYQHPELKEAFPFGRSDLANDKKLAALGAFDALTDYEGLDHKHFIVEGNRYAVEWLYHATWKSTKNKQVEASLCFARVKDQLLISWTEYFDDTVGELQDKHLLPLYGDPKELFPWPSPTTTTRIYRP
jgi:hypothetical protein